MINFAAEGSGTRDSCGFAATFELSFGTGEAIGWMDLKETAFDDSTSFFLSREAPFEVISSACFK
jgi:hypothetical protein